MQTLKLNIPKKAEPTKPQLDLSESNLDLFFRLCQKEHIDLETTELLIVDKFQGMGLINPELVQMALKERHLL